MGSAKGWFFALNWVVLIGLFNALFRFAAPLEAHPIILICQSMIFAGIILMALAGPGRLARDAILAPHTWYYGICYLGSTALFVASLDYISATEMSLLGRASIPMAFVISILIFKRHIPLFGYVGFLFMLAGLGMVVTHIPSAYMGIVCLIVLAFAVLQASQMLLSDIHRSNNKAKKSIKNSFRVTGVVLAITAIMFLLLALFGAAAAEFGKLETGKLLPTFADFLNPGSFILAIIYGVFGLAVIRYSEFVSTREIKFEIFLAITALSSLTTFAFEWLLDVLNLAVMNPLEPIELMGAIVVILGSIVAVHARHLAVKRETKPTKLPEHMERDRSLASHTLQYCNGNKTKAAKLLGVSKDILEVALYEEDPDRALPDNLSQKLQDNFTKNIAFLDPLSGLMNKTHFLSLFRDVLERGDKGTLLYLDLNKFKPINDTHGHEAGDEVLKIIAQRLTANINRNSLISRLGGDEFAILLTNVKEGQGAEIQTRLGEKIAEPIQLEGIEQSVTVGASIGLVTFPADGTDAEALLNTADKRMYEVKDTTPKKRR